MQNYTLPFLTPDHSFMYRTVMKQLFEAVEFIHSKHVVHRDLKVKMFLNIIVTKFMHKYNK